MSVIGWLVLGLIAGFIASKIVNKAGEGVILDIILGIVGAVVGGFLFAQFGAEGSSGSISTACLWRSSARSWFCLSTMLSWAAEAFDRRSFLLPTGRRAGAEAPPRKRQRPIGASLSRPAVLPVVGKSASVLEPARNTHLPAATASRPARAAIMAALARYSRPPTSPARSARVQGHTQGGRAEVHLFSGPYPRRDCERFCHTVGCDELPRCRAVRFAFPSLAFHTQMRGAARPVQAAARVSPCVIDRRFKRAR